MNQTGPISFTIHRLYHVLVNNQLRYIFLFVIIKFNSQRSRVPKRTPTSKQEDDARMLPKPIMRGKWTVLAIALAVSMVIMPFLIKPAMAADTCEPEEVAAPSDSPEPFMYRLDANCTLHISEGTLQPIATNGNTVQYPIRQHDKVRIIIFDFPLGTRLNDDSSHLFDSYPNVEMIKGLDSMDTSNVKKADYMFANLRNLKTPVDTYNLNEATLTSAHGMFANSNFDMFNAGSLRFNPGNSGSLDLGSMFKGATATKKAFDLSGWMFEDHDAYTIDTPDMFNGSTGPIRIEGNISDARIAYADRMFANTNSYLIGVDGLRTDSLYTAIGMFENAKPDNPIDLSLWDTKSLNIANQMFKGSDIDKFSGMNNWNLESLASAYGMYEDLNPSEDVRIQTEMPKVEYAISMFEGSDLNKFPDIANLHFGSTVWTLNMFRNAKDNYLDLSKWKLDDQAVNPDGMLNSPYITYTTFGNNDDKIHFTLGSTAFIPGIGDSSLNTWDDPTLPKEYAAKKWATLPIKPDCDAQFNGDPDNLPKNCWDDGQSWVSTNSGSAADNELFDGHHDKRIFFRAPSVPVNFNANGVENVQNMPDMKYFLKIFSSRDDMIPDTVPKDPTGARTFTSWNTQADGKGQSYNPGDHTGMDFQSLDLYAQWKTNNHSIRFIDSSKKGGNLPEDATSVHGSEYTIPDQAPTRKGYRFDGWASSRNGKAEYKPGDQLTITTDLTLYAVWSRRDPVISFDNNGGNGNAPAVRTKDESDSPSKVVVSIDCDSKPTKNGMTFIGWSPVKSDNLSGADAGKKGKVAVCGYADKSTLEAGYGETINLHAVWAKKPKAVFEQNRPKGMTALLPEAETVTGDWYVGGLAPRTYVGSDIFGWYKGYSPDGVYRFDGWVNEDGTPFTGTNLDRSDVEVKAKWSRIADNDSPKAHDSDKDQPIADDTEATPSAQDGGSDPVRSASTIAKPISIQKSAISLVGGIRPAADHSGISGTNPSLSSNGFAQSDDEDSNADSDNSSTVTNNNGSNVQNNGAEQNQNSGSASTDSSNESAETNPGTTMAKTGASAAIPASMTVLLVLMASAVVFIRKRMG